MKTHPELKTIRDFLRYATSSFNAASLYYGHGTDNAWDEAIALILHTLHLPYDVNPLVLDAQLTSAERKKLFSLIQKRIEKRIPVPYLTHEAWFAGLPFYVDERVLIPRSPIAELIEKQFAPWVEADQVEQVLDLCTGSGCLAIALAKAFPGAEVDACDISPEALAVAKINVLRHQVEDQVHLYQADLFKGLPPKRYDLIISNPPYVSQAEMEALPEEFRHEPHKALHGGKEGLDLAAEILLEANQYLSPNGILVIEVGNSEYALTETYPHIPFTWLEFERGGSGVFLLTAEQVADLSA